MMEPWKGEPLVRRMARTFLEANLDPVVVVVSPEPALRNALAALPVRVVVNPHPERGISSSIAAGVTALPGDTQATAIGVADQPYITADAVGALRGAFVAGGIAVPRYGDHRGNPAVFDRRFFAELLQLDGDRGGQRVIDAHPKAVIEVELPAAMGEDVDRPEQWPR